MRRAFRIVAVFIVLAVVAYTVYVGYEGSRQMVEIGRDRLVDCRTPETAYGWAYEPINYDRSADDEIAELDDPTRCPWQGPSAGSDLTASDGTPLAGWYVPAASDAGSAPTIILVHGHGASKSAMLAHSRGLHEAFNLVYVDLRNGGRSGGTQTTMGVREREDLRAVVDWVEREKGGEHIGVLGDSMGAATALALAVEDPRVDALILDSVHRSIEDNLAHRLPASGHPTIPGAWAILAGSWLRTGVDLTAADPIRTVGQYGGRPLMFLHGTADAEDLPSAVEDLVVAARKGGATPQIHWCEGATHGQVASTCSDAYADWVVALFQDAFGEVE